MPSSIAAVPIQTSAAARAAAAWRDGGPGTVIRWRDPFVSPQWLRVLGALMRAYRLVFVCALQLLPRSSYGAPAHSVLDPELAPAARAAAYASSTSQEQIIDAVEKRYHAKVVRVSATTVDGRPALRLRLLSAQRVWSVVVDAATGQVLAGG